VKTLHHDYFRGRRSVCLELRCSRCGVKRAVAGLQRCAKMGMPGAMISIVQSPGYDSPVYEPLWSAADDLQMSLCNYQLGTRNVPRTTADSAAAAQLNVSGFRCCTQ
jgi:hypothetical protein